MTRWRVPNGSGKAAIGVVLAALLALFAFVNGIPWATKAEVGELKQDIREGFRELRRDIRELRGAVEGRR